MYFSLSKKIFYTLFSLMIFFAVVFLGIFLRVYSEQYEETQNSAVQRNRYVVELLHENIYLRRELSRLTVNDADEHADIEFKEKELKRQQKISEQLQETYNQRWGAFIEGAKIIGLGSLLSLLLIIILGFLLQRWVILPARRLAEASRIVSEGDYSKRLKLRRSSPTFDELDILSKAFNNMLDNIEQNIAGLKNTELFLQSLIDAIPDGIRVIDRNYNVIMCNKAYLKQTKDRCLGKCYHAYGLEYPCPQGAAACPLQEIKNWRSKSVNIIHIIGSRPFSINAAPLKINKTENQDDFYVVEIMRDLSGEIRFSHEQKISSLGFLSTSVAHEMKNNLGAIRMILENLLNCDRRTTISDAERDKYLQIIYKQVVSSIEMPESLLRLAQNNHDETQAIDINSAVVEVLALLDYEAKRNGISVQYHNQTHPLIIEGNEADFKMILINLAQNAFKAMPNGGTFQIDVSKNKNTVMIKVIDSGIGIAPEKINHIFEPFYSEGRHARHRGTGLGLAIVKNLVEKFKGTISVNSVVDKGTSFEIKFPKSKRNNLQS